MRPRVTHDIDRYELITEIAASHFQRKKVFVGSNGPCRYCGARGRKKFATKAHLIPEALGNNGIFCRDECDSCNQLFAKYDDAIAKVLRCFHTLGSIKGKRGIPRTEGEGVLIERRDSGETPNLTTHVDGYDHKDLLAFDPARKLFRMRTPLPNVRFRPRHAYKALAKIGIGLLPANELNHFSRLINWLLDPNDNEKFHVLEVSMRHSVVANPPRIVQCTLLRRVAPNDNCPYMLALITVGAIHFQIDLMTDRMDEHLKFCTMGEVNINWSIKLSGEPDSNQITIEYADRHLLNWAPNSLEDSPFSSFDTYFDARRNIAWMKFNAREAGPK